MAYLLSAADGHHKPSDQNPRKLRIMAAGRCTAVVTSGRRRFPCDCPAGIFAISEVVGDPECQECAHPLSLHEDMNSQAPASPLNTKVHVQDAFQSGIKYRSPRSLVGMSGAKWKFQPHSTLYDTLGEHIIEHYIHYTENGIDKSQIPMYFYVGGAGTGKSRHASEFAFTAKNAVRGNYGLARRPELAQKLGDVQRQDLLQRLESAFVFVVSFENGTSLEDDDRSDLLNAIGVRMLHQLLGEPLHKIKKEYIASPKTIFDLVAKAENVNLYEDFTGILVVDGIHQAIQKDKDRVKKSSSFYGLLSAIGDLSLMKRHDDETEGGRLRVAPFILTCVTATYFGPIDSFLADTNRDRVYLPLNQIDVPTLEDGSPVFHVTPLVRLFVNDIGGHARAMELIADYLAAYPDGHGPTPDELAGAVHYRMKIRYGRALQLLEMHALPIAQCILARREINLQDVIPGSNTLKWEDVTAGGLIWFEKRIGTRGYLVAPYIWLWMLARTVDPNNPENAGLEFLAEFLGGWEFNDYKELQCIATGKGFGGNITWQSFERFCCSFRVLRSLGFGDGEVVPLRYLHSGCTLRDNQKKMVVNRHLRFAEAVHQYDTDSGRLANNIETRYDGTLNAEAQFSHVILNGTSAPPADFFLSIEIPAHGRSLGKTVRELGQCKLIENSLNQSTYDKERTKSAGPDDIFILYTNSKMTRNFALPDQSGVVDESCWHSYFGPFAGRAYMALKYRR